MYRVMSTCSEKGFTLLESIFHLMIFTLLIQMTLLFFYWKAPVEAVYQNDFLGEWELFSIELQQMLEEVEWVSQSADDMVAFKTKKGIITIHVYQQLIRKLVNNQGHVPLLTGVKSCIFTLEDQQLHIKVEKLNGVKKERTFAVGYVTE